MLRVLRQISDVPAIAETICVDDGSRDPAHRAIREHYPSVRVVRHDRNRGKAEAVKSGLEQVSGAYTLLLDADLKYLEAEKIQATITSVHEASPGPDMVIFRKKSASVLARIDRRDLVLSGDRLVKTSELRSALGPAVSGFQLEVAINDYMMRHRRDVFWVAWRAENTKKIEKYSWAEGLLREIRMLKNVVEFVGLRGFVRQLACFARRELPARAG